MASTVTLVREGHTVAIIDPGMVADRWRRSCTRSQALGVHPDEVTDVVFSHHHPDHTVNAALFLKAKVHDVMATYEGDVWTDRDPQDAGLGTLDPAARDARSHRRGHLHPRRDRPRAGRAHAPVVVVGGPGGRPVRA